MISFMSMGGILIVLINIMKHNELLLFNLFILLPYLRDLFIICTIFFTTFFSGLLKKYVKKN
jgi:hypothetical protein